MNIQYLVSVNSILYVDLIYNTLLKKLNLNIY